MSADSALRLSAQGCQSAARQGAAARCTAILGTQGSKSIEQSEL